MPISGMRFREAHTVATTFAFFLSGCLSVSNVAIQYATATFKVLNAYSGWSNVNYVLNDVKNPVRTLKIAGPLGLGICAVLYLLANVSYFAYVY
jgi:solute carrier family 7 (L-type amino acid transporter), member 9/15